ncbi:hypothetical protein [Microseira sp. BLCC-F43]|uniref:hypothetical protein n=1 Tax=Microseira sp. BLCC-F43 TaxID=3153602 RepID=UPI0035BB4226
MSYTLVCVAAALMLPLHNRSQKAVLHSVEIRCKIIETPPQKRLYTNNMMSGFSPIIKTQSVPLSPRQERQS